MFYLAQKGTSLYKIKTDGTETALTLPSGVTLSSTRRPRFAILGRNIVVVNSPSRNLVVSPDGAVRPMVYRGPGSSPIVAAGSGTGLTGAYKVWVSFRVRDTSTGKLLSESPLSPASASVTLTNQNLAVTGIPISSDSEVNARAVYRSAAGGTEPFEWAEIDGNVATSFTGDESDATLALLPEDPAIGIPPGTVEGFRLELITAWKNRLWAKSNDPSKVDYVLFSEEEKHYHWKTSSFLPIKPVGQDEAGITAFIARRDELGVGKRDMLAKISGVSESDFEVVVVHVGAGPVSQESCVVVNDVGYFLGETGVYAWSAEGVKRISEERVHAWFNTDTYFNRAQFENAIACYDPRFHAYVLGLAAAGSSNIDRWVMYTINDGRWWGPHKTGEFTPTAMQTLEDASDIAMPVFGASDGKLYKPNYGVFSDGSSTAIDLDVDTKFFSGDAPDIDHYWGQLSILSKIQGSGTLTITPKVGWLNSSAGTAISHDMTKGRERLRRLGVGKLAQLNLRQNTAGVGAQVFGMELPFHELGRR